MKKDFHQIVKVDDLSTLTNDELLDYKFELWNYSNAEAEYQRVQNEIDKRHIGYEYKSENEHITIEIQNDKKKYFSDIMKYINDSNVIPSRIKESLKEDILKTYTKDQPLGERFTTSKENAAVFNAAFNEVTTVNQGFGDYGFCSVCAFKIFKRLCSIFKYTNIANAVHPVICHVVKPIDVTYKEILAFFGCHLIRTGHINSFFSRSGFFGSLRKISIVSHIFKTDFPIKGYSLINRINCQKQLLTVSPVLGHRSNMFNPGFKVYI